MYTKPKCGSQTHADKTPKHIKKKKSAAGCDEGKDKAALMWDGWTLGIYNQGAESRQEVEWGYEVSRPILQSPTSSTEAPQKLHHPLIQSHQPVLAGTPTEALQYTNSWGTFYIQTTVIDFSFSLRMSSIFYGKFTLTIYLSRLMI